MRKFKIGVVAAMALACMASLPAYAQSAMSNIEKLKQMKVSGDATKMETVEHLAHIALVAHQLGDPRILKQEEIKQLRDAKTRYMLNAQ